MQKDRFADVLRGEKGGNGLNWFIFRFFNQIFFCRSVDRSSLPGMFCKKDVLKNFAKFTEKHLCHLSLFFNKVTSGACNTFFYGRPPVGASKKSFTCQASIRRYLLSGLSMLLQYKRILKD